MTELPRTVTVPCSLHRSHQPRPVVIELHHLLPRAWEHAFPSPTTLPAGAVPGHDADGPLWDVRTVALCPTAHRNVHAALVAMVRGRPHVGSPRERKVARLALSRAAEAGITIPMLLAAKQYGAHEK